MNRNASLGVVSVMVLGGLLGTAWAQPGGTATMQNAGNANVLTNPGFEEAKDGKPVGWAFKKWAGDPQSDWQKEGHNGGSCVRVTSEKGADAFWQGGAVVKPFSTYRLRAWIRTDNIVAKDGKGALVNVHTDKPNATAALTGTNDWTEVELSFDTGESDYALVNCGIGGWGQASGTGWFDDVSLELVSSVELKPEVTINASETKAPISKYIFGQFIEHLGHCIYGGIWAEMLDDRKFFHKVGSPESPWRVYFGLQGTDQKAPTVGGTVAMATDNPFVGEHTPEIQMSGKAPVGMMQGGLGLRNGKEYAGRIVLCGDPQAAPVEITLVWGNLNEQRQTVTVNDISGEYKTIPLRFTSVGDTDDGRIQIVGRGAGRVRVGAISLMPADNVNGMRADTLELLKQLDAPVYRWPGGNFVSGYNWRDGIGDPDKRPPRKNPAWKGVEHNDFGIHEFMQFCTILGTEPYVVVNSGLGKVEEAVAELEYFNGRPDSAMGQLRAQNGHPDSYGVKWWGIGNEMYGDWQLGHMPLAEYVKKHNVYAEAMRAFDPSIKLIGVGATGDWSKTMLADCSNNMDMLSEHFYCGEIPGVLSHVRQIPDNVRKKAEAHRQYHKEIPALAGKLIPICQDEWNYWYGPDLYGEIGTQYFLKDAIGIAAGIHEYGRNSDVFGMANYAQTVNVIGAIKTSKTNAVFDTTGLALMMYRHHLGSIPVAVSGDVRPLDVFAAFTEDRKTITVAIVNATETAYDLKINLQGVNTKSPAKRWVLMGAEPRSCNVPGKEAQVRIEESSVESTGMLSSPALTAAIYEIPVQ